MAYIGKSPTVGNFVKLDALTASATASYTMQLDSVNFSPESVNHMLVSLNGVIQAPTDSYTISGSTITFASALTASDSIDFIMVYGNVLDIGTPSDNTVSLAKLTASGTKDATTFLRGDNTFATVSGTTINNNADNRVITGSGTANTLEGEANLNFNGTNLMVNTNATTNTFSGGNDLVVGNTSSGTHGISIQTPNNEIGYLMFADDSTSPNPCFISYDHANNFQRFWVNGSERMRIDASGNILIGKTSNNWTADGIQFEKTSGTPEYYFISTRDDADEHISTRKNNATGSAIKFYYNSTLVGNITHTTSSTSYGTSSDYRLKENEVAISDGIERLKQLKPYRFNFKTDADITVDGFFAHEVSSVVPEAISGEKDDVDENGEIKPQNIDQSKLVPLLTSALQEAITKIETLETRIEALENA